ncbi:MULTISPECIES: hypothetical protein [Streptomyces]|jgi:hypothetical protein|uniref:hypothetical protein n=1 Tax=Streptomyces TaxID=1883 RepID=UPI000BC9156C|nr:MULTISPECIES: hypothetical protein [Streptomyces]MCX4430783.1 hypothetical protein [Streptomyces mirabilis]SOE79514.1 hypothetical protein SAMN05446589_8560 [Streptomyces sp. OV198]
MVKISDARVRELRERYWSMPMKQRPSAVSLAARLGTDSKTVWNWLQRKVAAFGGWPHQRLCGEQAAAHDRYRNHPADAHVRELHRCVVQPLDGSPGPR